MAYWPLFGCSEDYDHNSAMALFEFKVKISSHSKEELIDALGLEFIREYSDSDHYVKSTRSGPREKIKEVEGSTIYYQITINERTGLFQIVDTDITQDPNKISDLKRRATSRTIKRIKEIYSWHGMNVRVAFDYIYGFKDTLFMEVYADDQTLVLAAKNYLSQLGYKDFVLQTYDEMSASDSPLYKNSLAWIIVILVIAIGVVLLWKSTDEPVVIEYENDSSFQFMERQLSEAPLCSSDKLCTYYQSLEKCGPTNNEWIKLNEDAAAQYKLQNINTSMDILEGGERFCFRQRCVIKPDNNERVSELESFISNL